ncbi:MAG: transglycosylase domain-containing protein [Peptococcaceae bacterium]|nr:transglycosylase domain-containing protein [Peptococcaceae bacterium]
MKLLKKTVRTSLIIVICVILIMGGVLFADGYMLYNEAKKTTGVSTNIDAKRSLPNYSQIDELPQYFLDAVVAVEDHGFYEHGPVDFSSIARALFVNLKDMSPREGGSTITQQVAKNLYFTQEKSIKRKIAEALMAIKLENLYTKDEILELYINTNYYGSNYTGIKDASQGYFGKDPGGLNLYEATLLAGIPNAPSVYALNSNPELAAQRQQQVLAQMVEYGYLSQEEADEVSNHRNI